VIQTTFRRFVAQKQYIKEKQAAIQLQSVIRSFQAQKAYARTRSQIILLQTAARMQTARIQYLRDLKCMQTLQAWTRMCQCRNAYLEMRQQHRAAIVIQSAIRRHQALKLVELEQHSATVIQAHWRGFIARRRAHKRIQAAARKLALARKQATEEKKLGALTVKALKVLADPNVANLSLSIRACELLELATYVSSSCYGQIMEQNIVASIFSVITSCNRSEPHVKLVMLSLNILYNLVAASEETAQHVFDCKQSIDTLVKQMSRSYERTELLMRIVEVLSILCNDPARAWQIKQLGVSAQVQSVKSILERKIESASRSNVAATNKKAMITEMKQAVQMLRELLEQIHTAQEPQPIEVLASFESPVAAVKMLRVKTPRSALDHTPRLALRGVSRAAEQIEHSTAGMTPERAAGGSDEDGGDDDDQADSGSGGEWHAIGHGIRQYLRGDAPNPLEMDDDELVDDENILNDALASPPHAPKFSSFDRSIQGPSLYRASSASTTVLKPTASSNARLSTVGHAKPAATSSATASRSLTSVSTQKPSSQTSLRRPSLAVTTAAGGKPRMSTTRTASTSTTTATATSSVRDGAPRKSTTSERIAALRKQQAATAARR
jgi:hypothetical protein